MPPATNRAEIIERLADLDGRRLRERRKQQEAGQRLDSARTKLERAAADAEHRVHRTQYRQITTEMRELCAELGHTSIMQARQAGVLEPRRSSIAKSDAAAVTAPRRTGARLVASHPPHPQRSVDKSEVREGAPQGDGALIESRPPETPSSPRSRWLERIGAKQPSHGIVVDLTTETTTDDTGTTTCTIVTSATSGASGDLVWLTTFGTYIERWLHKPSMSTTHTDTVLHTVENGDGVWQAETYSEKLRGVAYVSFELRDHDLVWLEYGKAGADRALQATRNLDPVGGRRRPPTTEVAHGTESVKRSQS